MCLATTLARCRRDRACSLAAGVGTMLNLVPDGDGSDDAELSWDLDEVVDQLSRTRTRTRQRGGRWRAVAS